MTVSSFNPNTWVVFCLTWKLLWMKVDPTWGLNRDSMCCCRKIMNDGTRNAGEHESSLTSFFFNVSFYKLIGQEMVCHVTEKSENTKSSVLKKKERKTKRRKSNLTGHKTHFTDVLFLSCILGIHSKHVSKEHHLKVNWRIH